MRSLPVCNRVQRGRADLPGLLRLPTCPPSLKAPRIASATSANRGSSRPSTVSTSSTRPTCSRSPINCTPAWFAASRIAFKKARAKAGSSASPPAAQVGGRLLPTITSSRGTRREGPAHREESGCRSMKRYGSPPRRIRSASAGVMSVAVEISPSLSPRRTEGRIAVGQAVIDLDDFAVVLRGLARLRCCVVARSARRRAQLAGVAVPRDRLSRGSFQARRRAEWTSDHPHGRPGCRLPKQRSQYLVDGRDHQPVCYAGAFLRTIGVGNLDRGRPSPRVT